MGPACAAECSVPSPVHGRVEWGGGVCGGVSGGVSGEVAGEVAGEV